MKNWVLTFLFAVSACVASFAAFYAINRQPPAIRAAAQAGDAMEWLRVEFHLTEAQFLAIKTLHERYGAACDDHCRAIMAAERRNAPRAEVAALERACVESMTEHFHRVAALMSPHESERYLATVLPRVWDYDHRGSPNIQARR